MVILLDANIIIDALTRRIPFGKTAQNVITKCLKKQIRMTVAGFTIPTIYYILRDEYEEKERRRLLLNLCKLVNIKGVEKSFVINSLLNEKMPDFEDGLQEECAVSGKADYIITRNVKDFQQSRIPAILPEDFLKLLEEGEKTDGKREK